MVRLRSQHEHSNVCHWVTSSWMAGEGHVIKKKHKKKQKADTSRTTPVCTTFTVVFYCLFLNTQCIYFSGRKRCQCINVKLTVTKFLSFKGHLWHYTFVCFKFVYCWTVFWVFLLMLGTLEITSVPLFMSFLKKKTTMAQLVWFNAFQVFFFLTFSMQNCFSFKPIWNCHGVIVVSLCIIVLYL